MTGPGVGVGSTAAAGTTTLADVDDDAATDSELLSTLAEDDGELRECRGDGACLSDDITAHIIQQNTQCLTGTFYKTVRQPI